MKSDDPGLAYAMGAIHEPLMAMVRRAKAVVDCAHPAAASDDCDCPDCGAARPHPLEPWMQPVLVRRLARATENLGRVLESLGEKT